MVSQRLVRAAAFAAGLGAAAAQTASKCNPVLGQKCDADKAFGGDWTYDFTGQSDIKGLKDAWNLDGGVEFGSPATVTFDKAKGASFLMSKPGQAPTINTTAYMFFGKLEVTMQAAPGAGIISSIVLQTDDLDEIDWEFVGNHPNEVQTNYYQKGNFDDHSHGKTHALSINPQGGYHTYTIDWTPTYITWSIDGSVIRSQTPDKSPGVWPQTPAQVKIGTWPAGDAADKGTSDWAGGKVQWSGAPYAAVYKSIKVTDYGGGNVGAKEYSYGDTSGTWQSIKVNGGSKRAMPANPGDTVASGGSSSSSDKPTSTVSAKDLDTTATGVQAPVNPTAALKPNGTTLSTTTAAPKDTAAPTVKPGNSSGVRAAAPLALVGLIAVLVL